MSWYCTLLLCLSRSFEASEADLLIWKCDSIRSIEREPESESGRCNLWVSEIQASLELLFRLSQTSSLIERSGNPQTSQLDKYNSQGWKTLDESINSLKCIWHEIFFFGFWESGVYKKRYLSYCKTCLKFLKTSFFADKTPYFSLQNCPGDWDRIYRIVTSIVLIAFPRTQCFCYKSPQNVDIVQQYRGSFRNFQDLQWERTSRRKNRAV